MSNEATESSSGGVPSNDEIRTQVVRMYADFVSEVDPKGGIMDQLLQAEVLSFERKDAVLAESTRQERCRKLLDELFTSSNPRAFTALRDALLAESKAWIVDRIDAVRKPPPSDNVDSAVQSTSAAHAAPANCVVTENETATAVGSVNDGELAKTVSELREELAQLKAKNTKLGRDLNSSEKQLRSANNEIKSLNHQLETIRQKRPVPVFARKLVIVGDGATGKSCLLNVIRCREFPEIYMPTVFESFKITVDVDHVEVVLSLWDTAGQEDYDRLRPLSYPETDVFVIIFSVDSHASHEGVHTKWNPEVRHHCPRAPIVLAANKIDMRSAADLPRKALTTEEGQALAEQIGAAAYCECSAKTGDGVRELFETAARLAIDRSKKSKFKGICRQQ